MRSLSPATLAILLASAVSIAHAQPNTATSAKAAPASKAGQAQGALKPDAVLATVDGQKITERDLAIAYAGLSDTVKQQPQAQVLPQLLNELINGKALEIEARKEGLQNQPETKAAIEAADATVLQNALLRKDIAPQLTEDKIKAEFQAQYANKPGEAEVHAEHILVKTQAQAQALIDQLKKGADFATLAKANTTDPSGTSNGGDLGWFKKGDMVPAFSDAAFSLKPGQFSQTPVQSPYGWHVIKVLATRIDAPQTYDQVHDTLAQTMEQDALRAELVKYRTAAKVVVYGADGKPVPQTATSK